VGIHRVDLPKSSVIHFDWPDLSKPTSIIPGRPSWLFRWNLTYADAYAEMLWEENTVGSLKSTVEVVQTHD
jgi:hypothetical protein